MKTVKFSGTGKELPVGKILCLGRNYVEHATEMAAAVPVEPVVFLKPASAIIYDGEEILIPSFSRDVHHEVEMVVVIGKEARHIGTPSAMDHVAGYAVGLDMTLRDIQTAAKKAGLPWTVAKGFDTSAPVSSIMERDAISDPHNLTLSLCVNGATRQKGSTGNMIFRIDTVISYLSSIFTLYPGDLIFTGTPAGVARVVGGDILEADLENVGTLNVRVSSQQ